MAREIHSFQRMTVLCFCVKPSVLPLLPTGPQMNLPCTVCYHPSSPHTLPLNRPSHFWSITSRPSYTCFTMAKCLNLHWFKAQAEPTKANAFYLFKQSEGPSCKKKKWWCSFLSLFGLHIYLARTLQLVSLPRLPSFFNILCDVNKNTE